jgi:hypothetical protein
MKSARTIVGALLGAALVAAASVAVALPATAAPPQLSAVSELPADWTCESTGDCLDFSGYASGAWRGKSDANAWGTSQCGSGQNCVHYVAWRVVNEWTARDATPAGLIAANACPLDINPTRWDTAAAACGWVVDQAAPQAGDILQYDSRQRLGKYGSLGGSGHVDFIDAVEVTESGETLLHISHSGCSTGANIRRTVTLSEVIAANIDIIHVPYTRDQGAFNETATNADMAQWLYRLAGSPEVDVSFDPFATLNAEDPQFRAAVWMHTTGIAPANEFDPIAVLDRQAMAAFLYRYDALGTARTQANSPMASPADLAESAYPTEVAWIVGAGFATASDGVNYQPTIPVTTETLAEVLYAYEGSPAVKQPEKSPWYDIDASVESYDAALWTWNTYVSRDRFADVPMNHAQYAQITTMHANGLVTPLADNTFGADQVITRQDVAAFLYRLAGRPTVATTGGAPFTDVLPGHPFFTEINWMVQQQLVTGYPDGTFKPTDSVSRQSLAVFLYRAAGSPAYTPPREATFADVGVGDLNRKEIEWANSVGALTGTQDGLFAPSADATRGSLVALVTQYATAQATVEAAASS